MDETKVKKEDTKKTNKETSTSRNQLFEEMMKEGTMNAFLKGLPENEQEEWKDFASKTMSHYDKIICMIRETTNTEKGKEQFRNELMKAVSKK